MNSTQCYFAGVEIHISRGEDQSGPFTLEQVQDYLAQGVLLPDDLAWHEGLDGWIPLSELAGSPSVAPALPQSPIQSEPAIANATAGAGGKKKLLIGVGAGVAMLTIAAVVWFMRTPEKGVQAEKNLGKSQPVSPNIPNPNPQIDKLTPEEVANLFADDIGKWKIIGKGKPEGGDPVPFEDIIEVRWRVKGKSTVATFSPMINGEKVFFVGHKEYDAKEGVFIWRSKGVELPENVSREQYDPATKIYRGKSTFSDGAKETSTFEIVSKDKRLFRSKIEVDGKVVFSMESVLTRMNENRSGSEAVGGKDTDRMRSIEVGDEEEEAAGAKPGPIAQTKKPGTVLWEFETGGLVESSPAIGFDGTVYVGSADKKVYALDGRSGARKWEFVTGGDVSSSPAIGSDGTV